MVFPLLLGSGFSNRDTHTDRLAKNRTIISMKAKTETSTEKMERTLPIAATSAELCGECACIAAMTTTNF